VVFFQSTENEGKYDIQIPYNDPDSESIKIFEDGKILRNYIVNGFKRQDNQLRPNESTSSDTTSDDIILRKCIKKKKKTTGLKKKNHLIPSRTNPISHIIPSFKKETPKNSTIWPKSSAASSDRANLNKEQSQSAAIIPQTKSAASSRVFHVLL
jgi:hypothetical protein